jgi:hypothetical protein
MLNDQTSEQTGTAPETTERINRFVQRQTQKRTTTKGRATPRTVARAGLKPVLEAVARGDYRPPTVQMTKAERVADFLYWASQHYERIGLPNEFITMVVEGLPKPATKGSPEMKLVMGKMAGVKKIIKEKHGRLVYQKDGTTRMCVDELDEALHIGPKVDKMAYRALVRAKTFHDEQDLSGVEITDENRAIIEQQKRASDLVNDMIKQAEIALLPPKQ